MKGTYILVWVQRKQILTFRYARFLLRKKCLNSTHILRRENDVQYEFMEKTEILLKGTLPNPLVTHSNVDWYTK